MSGRMLAFDSERPELLADLLTHPNELQRIVGRLAATGLPDTVRTWVGAELARGSDGALILQALAAVEVAAYASMVGSLLNPAGFPAGRALIDAELDRAYEPTAQGVRASVAAREAGQ